jgi:hypothetical protein
LIQLLSDPALEKEVIADLPNKKPILLVVTDETMNEQELRLIISAQYICSYGHYSFLSLPIAAFESTKSAHLATAKQLTYRGLDHGMAVYLADSVAKAPVIAKHYPRAGKQTGSMCINPAVKNGKTYRLELYDGQLSPDSLYQNQTFEFGVWTKCDHQYPFLPQVIVEIYNAENQLQETKYFDNFREPMHVYKDWVLHLNAFVHTHPLNRYRIYMQFDYPFEAGNLLIKPQGVNVYLRQDKHFYFNYFPLN